jgi:hypothetical protein
VYRDNQHGAKWSWVFVPYAVMRIRPLHREAAAGRDGARGIGPTIWACPSAHADKAVMERYAAALAPPKEHGYLSLRQKASSRASLMAVCDGRQAYQMRVAADQLLADPLPTGSPPWHKGKSPHVPRGVAREGAVRNLDFRLAVRYKHPA